MKHYTNNPTQRLRPNLGLSIVLTFCGFAACNPHAGAAVLFTDNFNGFTAPEANFNGGQYQSNLAVAYSGSLPGWTGTGDGTVHAVDTANVYPTIPNPRDFAPMIWQNNVITLSTAITGSNEIGTTYEVNYSASAAVYQSASQQTSATDGLLVELLRSNNTVAATHTYLPGAWTGTISMSPVSFSYTGDGTGDLRLRVGPSAFNSGRFGGAIDNLTLSSVPEPGAATLMALGSLVALRRKRRA